MGIPGATLEPKVTSYPFNRNRLLIIDWASLSYHQMFALNSPKMKKALGVLTAEEEQEKWRNMMFQKVLDYVALFNPKHMVFALEGKHTWRNDFVKDWYNAHTEVYYDAEAYYVVSDNEAFKVTMRGTDENGNASYAVVKIPVKEWGLFTNLKHRTLGTLPSETQYMLWGITQENGKPIIPVYKGQRKSSDWPFMTEKSVWREMKENFATDIAPMFRARAIRSPKAEGDDIVFSSIRAFGGDAEDIIIITRDSDLSQIDNPKVKIFNHVTENFIKCKYPQEYLSAKILSGDSSDNINGMAFVDKKTGMKKPTSANRIGESGAITLLENCPNIYDTAKKCGWDDQYMRNKTLIDLSMVPDDIEKGIMESVNVEEPPLFGYDRLPEMKISDNRIKAVNQMRAIGFYAFLPLETVESNPDIFKSEEYEAARAGLQDSDPMGISGGIADVDVFASPDVVF